MIRQIYITVHQFSKKFISKTTVPSSLVFGVPSFYTSFRSSTSYENEKQLQATKNRAKQKVKHIALAMGYCGKNYTGMQRAFGLKTIEEELFSALYKSNVISFEEFTNPHLLYFQRTSRTDKGVSAIRQIVSFKIALQSSEDNFVKEVNSHLPPDIRIYGYKTVTSKFDSRLDCNSRSYSYLLPTFAFTPMDKLTLENYRIPDSVLTTVNEILQMFRGTFRFHNFTSKMSYDDKSCLRVMRHLQCDKPFIRENIEFTTIHIKGDSFMLHQIRKMIGLTIAIVRGIVPPSIISKCFEPGHVDIPKAPANGLFLEEVDFNRYNKRKTGDGQHEQLQWDEYKNAIVDMKEKVISSIIRVELTEKIMFRWLNTILYNVYEDNVTNNETGNKDKSWMRVLARSLKTSWYNVFHNFIVRLFNLKRTSSNDSRMVVYMNKNKDYNQ